LIFLFLLTFPLKKLEKLAGDFMNEHIAFFVAKHFLLIFVLTEQSPFTLKDI